MVTIRAATPEDADTIINLNARSVSVTSPMDKSRFLQLLDLSCLCSVVEFDGQVAGFVLAMRAGAEYDNGNFQWFSDRLKEFIYVDRVVVADVGRGKGLGSALYAYVTDWAEQQKILAIAAEMDLIPANSGSLNFHKKQGFVALGSRELESGKIVSMQVKQF